MLQTFPTHFDELTSPDTTDVSEQEPLVSILTVSLCVLQGAPTSRPEEELDRLTKKLVYDMNHPPVEEYFGMAFVILMGK